MPLRLHPYDHTHTDLVRDEVEIGHTDGLHEGTVGGHSHFHCVVCEGQDVGTEVDQVLRFCVPHDLH